MLKPEAISSYNATAYLISTSSKYFIMHLIFYDNQCVVLKFKTSQKLEKQLERKVFAVITEKVYYHLKVASKRIKKGCNLTINFH